MSETTCCSRGRQSNLVDIANTAIIFLIERHAIFQRSHRNPRFALAAMWHIYVQADRFAVRAHVRVRDASKIAGNEGKQVRGNAMGAVEHAVAMAIHNVAFEQVAIGQHDRKLVRVPDERGGETGQNVGAIDEIGDIAEAFSFTLRDKRPVRTGNRELRR
jgi:hypothetical protein